MSGTVIAVIVIIVIVIIAVSVYTGYRRRQTSHLKEQFGPEYDRAVDQYGSERKAQPVLMEREERVKKLDIKPLDETQRQSFAGEWQTVQANFVDDPSGSIGDADRLIGRVMEARGYPVSDFEQRAADVSVEHPSVVEHYRAAHDVARQNLDGTASTEDLRQAMVHYRALFEDLLGTQVGQAQQTDTTQ